MLVFLRKRRLPEPACGDAPDEGNPLRIVLTGGTHSRTIELGPKKLDRIMNAAALAGALAAAAGLIALIGRKRKK